MPRFQSGGGLLSHTGGTSSLVGMINYPRFPISDFIWEKFPDSMEFQSWNVKFRNWNMFKNQQILISQCNGSKKLRWRNQIDALMTSQSITGRKYFPDYDFLDAMIASTLKKTSRQASSLPKKSKCRRAACSKIRPILTRKTKCLHDLWAFPCNWSLWSGTRTLRFVHCAFAEWRHPRFRRSMGSSSIISPWYAFQMWSWKDCTSQTYKTLLSIRPSWNRMIRKLLETMGQPKLWTIEKLQWNFILIKWWEIGISKPGTTLWKGDQLPRVNKLAQGDLCSRQKRKGRSSSPRTKFEGHDWRRRRKIRNNIRQQRGKLVRQNERQSMPKQDFFFEKIPSCKFWHPPVCQNYKSETGCKNGRKCFFRHVEADEMPSK